MRGEKRDSPGPIYFFTHWKDYLSHVETDKGSHVDFEFKPEKPWTCWTLGTVAGCTLKTSIQT